MRWKFPDPSEAPERERILARIDTWWRAFTAQAPRLAAFLSQREQWDLPTWMNEHLEPLHPQLMWEFGKGHQGGYRLVITPEAVHHLCPLVDVLLSRAPTLPGWEFHPWRLPESASMALRTAQARTGVDLSGYQASVSANTEEGTLDLLYTPRSLLSRLNPFRRQDEAVYSAAVITTEALLGEELLGTRVRSIRLGTKEEGVPLESLAARVQARVRECDGRRPRQPLHTGHQGATWVSFEHESAERDDYPEMGDLLTTITRTPALFASAHSQVPFSSQRFSRHGETFCYLKLDGTEGPPKGDLQGHSKLEDLLNDRLIQEGLGCISGRSTGRRYGYLYLALMDVERALPILRDVLQRGLVSRRSWLLFFDSRLSDEWIPIWEDAPPPPLARALSH